MGNTAKQFDSFQPDQLSFDVTSPVVFYGKQAAPDKETLFMVVQRGLITSFKKTFASTLYPKTWVICELNHRAHFEQLPEHLQFLPT